MPERTGYAAESITKEHRDAVRRSRQLLAGGKEYREATREAVWRRSQAQYEGDHWSRTEMEDPTADLITVNVSFSTVNTIIPYVTSEDPRFLVVPFSAQATQQNARIQQAMLNKIWRRGRGLDAARIAAEDYLVYGDGYIKPTWAIVEKVAEDGTVTEVVDIAFDAVSPWDIWLDPFSTGMRDARWVAQRILTSRREFEADDRYDQELADQIPWGTFTRDEETDAERDIVSEDDGEWVEIFEFYDRIDRALYVFTEDGPEDPLLVVEEIDCPISPLANYRIPQSPYHMGELEQLWPMQQELNKTRSQLITHRRRNIGKYVYKQASLSEDGIAALTSPIINQGIEVLGDLPLDSAIKPLQLAALTPDAYNSADQAMRDMYEISGVNEYLRGATPEIRRTATEASIIEGASNVKTRAKLADVERCVRFVGEYTLAIMKEVFPETDTDEMAMFLTGPEAEQLGRAAAAAEADEMALAGAPQAEVQGVIDEGRDIGEVTLTPTDDVFVGEYEVEVESGSTEMRNPVFKEQKYREMAMSLIQMGPSLQQMGVNLNVRKILEMWFEAAGIADVEGMFDASDAMDPTMAGGLGAILPGAGDPGGTPQGQPNIAGVGAPVAPVTAENTGAIPLSA